MRSVRLVASLTVALLLASAGTAVAAPAIPGPPQFQGDLFSPFRAAVRAHALLGYLPLPATATPAKASPSLPGAHDVPSQDRVVRSRWWTVPGTAAQLAAFLQTHIPDGFDAPVVTVAPHHAVHLSYATQATFPAHNFLDVTYLPGAAQVQLRVDAEVVWLPRRSPLELVPLTTRAVEIDVRPTFADSGLSSRHLVARGGEIFGKLVPQLDDAPASPPGQTGCPPVLDGWTTTLTFRIGHRVVVFRWFDGGCDVMSVTVNGKAAPALEYRIDDEVKYIVGLPYRGEAP